MKLHVSKLGLVTVSVLALTLTSLPVAVGATEKGHVESETKKSQTSDNNTKVSITATDDSTMTTTSVSDETTTTKDKLENKKEAVSKKKAEAKLKSCEKHKTVIVNTMKRISDRGQKQLDLFSTIATRTETFYDEKGKTLSNYDALVADVDAKKAAAQSVVTSIADASTTFTCDGTTDAKAQVKGFKDSLKSETGALKAYKTSVKNLIVGVKSVQSTASTDDTTGGDQ